MTAAFKPPDPSLSPADALATIARHAQEVDAGIRNLSHDMALMVRSGMLGDLCDPRTPVIERVTLLRRIGRANLSVGRLVEGHMNALRLIAVYGTSAQRDAHFAAASRGVIYGVWGANGAKPLEGAHSPDAALGLTGGKSFTSGLGTIGCALVTAATPDGTQMALAPVEAGERADASSWNTTGMRATASGSYDFTGIDAEPLGQPCDYEREPHFQGGVWRYVALHVGGLELLAEEVRSAVAAFGDGATEAQLHRVARIAGLAHGARLLVEDAAARIEAPGAGPSEVALVLMAREAVEAACVEGISIADRALGARSFAVGQPVERVRRDLAFFLRQADLDGKLRLAGKTLCDAETGIGETWGPLWSS
ncbi:acyl-CoA dehydrogenase [Tepidamorphus sp. 3E244]|uniref:acyl-CoA dehydrogenase n=1 Tax=Tepidamorphus sp. 3E244 TaxID=3385498 RepID=UPI0038FC065D